MFEKHQLLFPLLVALEMKKDQGEITPRELELLGRDMGDLDSQLDAAGDSNKSNLASKPRWVTDKVRISDRPTWLKLNYCPLLHFATYDCAVLVQSSENPERDCGFQETVY